MKLILFHKIKIIIKKNSQERGVAEGRILAIVTWFEVKKIFLLPQKGSAP